MPTKELRLTSLEQFLHHQDVERIKDEVKFTTYPYLGAVLMETLQDPQNDDFLPRTGLTQREHDLFDFAGLYGLDISVGESPLDATETILREILQTILSPELFKFVMDNWFEDDDDAEIVDPYANVYEEVDDEAESEMDFLDLLTFSFKNYQQPLTSSETELRDQILSSEVSSNYDVAIVLFNAVLSQDSKPILEHFLAVSSEIPLSMGIISVLNQSSSEDLDPIEYSKILSPAENIILALARMSNFLSFLYGIIGIDRAELRHEIQMRSKQNRSPWGTIDGLVDDAEEEEWKEFITDDELEVLIKAAMLEIDTLFDLLERVGSDGVTLEEISQHFAELSFIPSIELQKRI